MWTKDDIRTVSKAWETMTNKEICEKLNINYSQLVYITQEMRKIGFNLPKKHTKGYVKSLLLEVKAEMGK